MRSVFRKRRRALGALALASAACLGTAVIAQHRSSLPVGEIERVVEIQGSVENGVLDLPISRSDIGEVKGPEAHPVTFTSAFQLDGEAFFQPLPNGQAFLNGDIPLRESETDPFISALLKNGLVFQAFHQHLPMHEQVWYVHFRGVGDPIVLAHKLREALRATGTPLPQSESTSTTPLDPKKLESILHGHASVGEEGVVTVWVYRRNPVNVAGVWVNPQANISTNIQFRPTGGGSAADVVSDFSMTSRETQPVINLMLNHLGWYQGCLYNQETAEHPQLYFDHMLKSGDAYDLAREIRRGLDLTDAVGSPENGRGHEGGDD